MTILAFSIVISFILLVVLATQKYETLYLIFAIMIAPLTSLVVEWNLSEVFGQIYLGIYVGAAFTLYVVDWRKWRS